MPIFSAPARLVYKLAAKMRGLEQASEMAKGGRETLLPKDLTDALTLPENFSLSRKFANYAQDEWKKLIFIKSAAERAREAHPEKYTEGMATFEKAKEELRMQVIKWREAFLAHRTSLDRLRAAQSPDVFSQKDFEKRVADFKKLFERGKDMLTRTSSQEKQKFALDMRRRSDEIRFLLNYALENLTVEVRDGRLILVEYENEPLDLTEVRNTLTTTHATLQTIELYESLEKKRREIRPKDFLKLTLEERLTLVTNLTSWRDLKPGTLIVINFGGNEALEQQIGLGDLMPPEIREFEVNGITYTRKGNQGFYYNGSYLPIFDGSRVTVKHTDARFDAAKALAQKFSLPQQKYEYKPAAPTEGSNALADVAADFGVDAYFLESVVTVMKDGDVNEDITDREEFLHVAARYIQNAEQYYESHAHKPALENGHYSVSFIVFALDHFSLFTNYTGQSAPVVRDVIASYAQSRHFEAKYDEEKRPPPPQKRPAEFLPSPQLSEKAPGHPDERIARLKQYYETRASRGQCTQLEADTIISNTQIIYDRMREHAGDAYHGTVGITRPDGSMWNINNNCVGAAMKTCDGTSLRMQSGRQAGKPLYNFAWGHYRDGTHDYREHPWLKSMIRDHENHLISIAVTPENADTLVGRYLTIGECAPAGFWNHALWIYKDVDGRIMMHHSGADVRPKEITLREGQGLPSGYERSGSNPNSAIRLPGSKVNDVHLSYFLAHTKAYRPPRNEISFVPLRFLVQENLS